MPVRPGGRGLHTTTRRSSRAYAATRLRQHLVGVACGPAGHGGNRDRCCRSKQRVLQGVLGVVGLPVIRQHMAQAYWACPDNRCSFAAGSPARARMTRPCSGSSVSTIRPSLRCPRIRHADSRRNTIDRTTWTSGWLPGARRRPRRRRLRSGRRARVPRGRAQQGREPPGYGGHDRSRSRTITPYRTITAAAHVVGRDGPAITTDDGHPRGRALPVGHSGRSADMRGLDPPAAA